MNNDALNLLLKDSSTLVSTTEMSRSQTHPELIELAVSERKRFRIRIQQAKHQLTSEIAERQAWKRVLDIADMTHQTDIGILTDAKWVLIRGAKDDSTHSGS